MIEFVHPALLFIAGALPIPFLSGPIRRVYLLLIPALAIAAVVTMASGSYGAATFLGQEILLAKVDKLSMVFATVFTIMALIGMVYALHVKRPGQHVAAYIYVGSALGVVFAGDYLIHNSPCVALILVSKFLGHQGGLMRREEYYE